MQKGCVIAEVCEGSRKEATRRWNTRSTHPDSLTDNHALADMNPAHNVREATIRECAELIKSGAGMADLIDQDELDQQAKYILDLLSPTPTQDKPK
jgi:hypothetical protein